VRSLRSTHLTTASYCSYHGGCKYVGVCCMDDKICFSPVLKCVRECQLAKWIRDRRILIEVSKLWCTALGRPYSAKHAARVAATACQYTHRGFLPTFRAATGALRAVSGPNRVLIGPICQSSAEKGAGAPFSAPIWPFRSERVCCSVKQ
jgi:hypothetical protein